MRQEGLTEKEISDGLGYKSTKDYRNAKSIAINEKRQGQINQAQKLKDTGMSTSAIGREMGINESTVRSLLEPGAKDKVQVLESTKSMLKDSIDKKEYIDIGSGVENHLGIHDPISISSKRVAINYAEDGGDKADGVIYVRPGVKDISLGGNHYAQV